jgi:hypothetical protein
MKANELLKKLGNTLLGKKSNTPAAGDMATVIQTAAEVKAPEVLLLDRLGVIQLHEKWRNVLLRQACGGRKNAARM